MPVRIGTGLSTSPDARAGAVEASLIARRGLNGGGCDLAVVFASGTHVAVPEATLEGVQEALAPRRLVGCAAGGVIGDRRELEDGTGVAVWAAQLADGEATTFHATVQELGDSTGALSGMPDLGGADGALMLADPATFPTDAVLRFLGESAPAVPVLGGLASARTLDGGTALLCDEDVHDDGAVGVRLDGVEMLPCVSQGATPLGPELTITAAEGNVISELAGRPALEKLRETLEALTPDDLRLVRGGLLMGIVVEGNKPEYVQGDFLVRGLVGADPSTGEVSVAADIHPGQVVRLHARDAASADRDLRDALGVRMRALGGRTPAGALVFSCNGRGRGMFGTADHDAEAVDNGLAGAPAAGFFAAGEIGPVGGQPFLHSFTATLAVFA